MMCRKLQKLVPTQEAIIECWCQLLSYKTLMFWQSHNIQSDSRLGQLPLGVHYCFELKAVKLLISAILEDRNQWVYRYTRYRMSSPETQMFHPLLEVGSISDASLSNLVGIDGKAPPKKIDISKWNMTIPCTCDIRSKLPWNLKIQCLRIWYMIYFSWRCIGTTSWIIHASASRNCPRLSIL